MVRLEKWSVCETDADPYTPPEFRSRSLQGRPYGHPHKQDGENIVTSRIERVAGRVVTTHSGTVYALGWPDPKYFRWLRENGFAYDRDNPIAFNKRAKRLP